MLPARLIAVTILAATAMLGACNKEDDQQATQRQTTTSSHEETTSTQRDAPPQSNEHVERQVVDIQRVAPKPTKVGAGPTINPRLFEGYRYERSVSFRARSTTRVERAGQSMDGESSKQWSMRYSLTPITTKADGSVTANINIINVLSQQNNTRHPHPHLPEEGDSFRCQLSRHTISCDNMSHSQEQFAHQWLYATWNSFMPSGTITPGERWQKRGTFSGRFGIAEHQPTTVEFEVSAIERLKNDTFRVLQDITLDTQGRWQSPEGDRNAPISGSGRASYDSLLRVMTNVQVGWDGTLVHEGLANNKPYRFTRRTEATINIKTSTPQGAPDRQVQASKPPKSSHSQANTRDDGDVGKRPY